MTRAATPPSLGELKLKSHRHKGLKVLPLRPWVKLGFPAEVFIEEPAIFNRDGWYYDRLLNISWVEYRGKAYIFKESAHYNSFAYELKVLDSHLMSIAEEEQVNKLLGSTCDKELIKLLRRKLHENYDAVIYHKMSHPRRRVNYCKMFKIKM